jgi:K+-transporting ATPase ATPase C chain
MRKQMKIAIRYLLIASILTGIAYPLLMTGLAQIIFPGKAKGSLVERNGRIIGSRLIGQKFDSTIYFSSRPSAIDYNPVPSSGSNLGPTSARLRLQVTERRTDFALKNELRYTLDVPAEMIFASASGLDPHISPGAALLQINRIAKSRSFDKSQKQELQNLVNSMNQNPQFSIFGEPRINVFELNLALDSIK